jgi:hypothetical protein
MKTLRQHLTEYVAARRALGTRLEEPAQTLRQFVRFLARKQAGFITIPLVLEWSRQSKGVQRATWGRKLSMVRQFARWMTLPLPLRLDGAVNGAVALWGCSSLSSVTLGDGVTSIGNRMFGACYGLKKIAVSATNPS